MASVAASTSAKFSSSASGPVSANRATGVGPVATATERVSYGRSVDRFVYSITAEGRERLGAWLAEPAREQPFRSELLLKLFFGRHRPVAESIRHVERFRERQTALKRSYADSERALLREQRAHPELPYWLITLRFGQSRANALLRWSEQTLETLERLSRAPARRAKKG